MQDYEITQGVDSSPAQRLMERRNRTLLPTVQSLLEPRNPVKPHESEQLRFNQLKQARYYNLSVRDLPVLKAGDTVQMKPFVLGQKSWEKACLTKAWQEVLVKTAEPSVQWDTSERPTADANSGSDHSAHQQTQAPAVQISSGKDHLQASPKKHHTVETHATPSPRRTRCGQIIREPAKLSDYVRIWTVLLRYVVIFWLWTILQICC